MPSADVNYPQGPMPLTRLNPWYPGQFGVPGTDTETGLRMHCSGAVFYVDPNYTGVSDQRDGTNPTSPLATVAAALALCQPCRGDTIAIMANNNWIYGDASQGYTTPVQENVIVTVPGVRIVGVGLSSAAGVYWESATVGGTCITVRASDILIEGIAFIGESGTEVGIHAEWSNVNDYYGDLMTVRHCFFDGDLGSGITLDFSWYGDIHHNRFDECQDYGIYNAAADGDVAYASIHHNDFRDIGTTAIMMPDADRCKVWENQFYNVSATTGIAAPNAFIDLNNGSRNLVHHNTMSCILPAAVAWDYNATCTAGAGDAWIQNYLMNGVSVTNPT